MDDEQTKRSAARDDRTSQLRREYLSKAGPVPASLAGAGIELFVMVAVLALGGWVLDGRFATGPWIMIGGLLVGLVGGIYRLWRVGKRIFESSEG